MKWNKKVLLIIAIISIFLPPIVSKDFDINKILQINAFLLTHSIMDKLEAIFPIFNLIALISLLGVICCGVVFGRIFSIHLFITYILCGILQNISITNQYGFAVSTTTLVLSLLIAFAWLHEWIVHTNTFSYRTHEKWIYLLLPFALLALWQPVNPSTLLPDFNFAYFLTSGSSLTFCMMTIVSLAVMISYYPNINMFTLKISSLAGLLIGMGNLWLEFIYLPNLFWIGVIHIPLVALSTIGLMISSGRRNNNIVEIK